MSRSNRSHWLVAVYLCIAAYGGPARADIIDDIWDAIQTTASRAQAAADRAAEARDRAAEARDSANETRNNIRNAVLLMTGQMRDLITETAGDLQTEVDDFLDGRDAFVADGGCSVAVCQPFRAEMVALLQNMEDLSNALLTVAGVEGMTIDLSTEIALLQAVPGRLLFPLYVGISETDFIGAGLSDRLAEAADALVVLQQLLEEPDDLRGGGPLPSTIRESELLACQFVLTDPDTGEFGPGGPRRARNALKPVTATGASLKLIGELLLAAGEGKTFDVPVQIHGYVGVSFKDNKKKKAGTLLSGVADVLLHLSNVGDVKVRACISNYAHDRTMTAIESLNQ
jgi:hypothetical protein